MTKLSHSFSYTVVPKAPYNFNLTMKKPAGWSVFTSYEVFDEGTLWTAFAFEGVLLGLRLRSLGTTDRPKVSVTVFTRIGLDAGMVQRIKDALYGKLGMGQDLRAFYAAARKDKILKHVVDDLYGLHDTDSGSVFDITLLAICLQMANIKRSNQMMDAMMKKYGEVAEFDGRKVRVWPLPHTLAVVDAKKLAKDCNLGYRAKSIVRLAKKLDTESFPSIEDLERMEPEKAKETLLELPGVGDYSADIINPHGGFPIDVWSAEVFGKLFFGREPRNNRAAVERVKREGLRRWGIWAWMAFYYVAQDLENLSRKLGVKLRLE